MRIDFLVKKYTFFGACKNMGDIITHTLLVQFMRCPFSGF